MEEKIMSEQEFFAELNRIVKARAKAAEEAALVERRKKARRRAAARAERRADICLRRTCWMLFTAAVLCVGCAIGAVAWQYASAITVTALVTTIGALAHYVWKGAVRE